METHRIRKKEYLDKIITPEQAAEMIESNSIIGVSGFTPSGYPKAIPLALSKCVGKNGITIITGASVGPEIDQRLVESGVMKRRIPYQTNKVLRNGINNGTVEYIDQHLSHTAQQVRNQFLGKMNYAIIEACSITESGGIVPTSSVGNSPTFIQEAEKVFIEINTKQPVELEGMHDIYIPLDPPMRKAIPLNSSAERIGIPFIKCDSSKIAGIVFTDIDDKVRPLGDIDYSSKRMARNLIDFLRKEVVEERLPKNLLPLQSGVGSVANAVLAGLLNSEFENLEFYSEVIQDSVFDLLDSGKMKICSATSITPSEQGLRQFRKNIEQYRKKIILRPQEISNNPEVIRRLGIISMNTAIEADIYGNVNSTHIMGTKMMNGIGGSGDFTRNAYLSIFFTPSITKDGDISCIVPFVSHVDHTDHDVSILITEQGYADLRNKSPKERALEIIKNCVHPYYKDFLFDYFDQACKACNNSQTPHLLEKSLSWHQNFLKTGTMKQSTCEINRED